ncbi:MAG: SPW repeat protein [Patescibacteria group bacterium]
MKNFDWIFIIFGIWLIIAPFIIGYAFSGAFWNDILTGIALIVISILFFSRE